MVNLSIAFVLPAIRKEFFLSCSLPETLENKIGTSARRAMTGADMVTIYISLYVNPVAATISIYDDREE